MAKFSSEQIKEILAIHETTLMKFFASSMERLENKLKDSVMKTHVLNKKRKA